MLGDVDSITREMRTLELKAEDETPGGAVAAASEPEEKYGTSTAIRDDEETPGCDKALNEYETVSIASTEKASSGVRRKNRRKNVIARATLEDTSARSTQALAPAPAESSTQLSEPHTKCAAPVSCASRGVQCNLGNDEYLTIERENQRLRRERACSTVEARIYKTRLEAYLKLEGEYNSDDDSAEDNSEPGKGGSNVSSSPCSGFSDIGDPDGADGAKGCGIKLVLRNLPPHWTGSEYVARWLTQAMKHVNFIGVRNGRAAVFVNSWQEAMAIKEQFHLSLAEGRVVKIKIEDDEEYFDGVAEEVCTDIEPGDIVELEGLSSCKGKLLNGETGLVVKVPLDAAERVGIQVGVEVLSFQRANLRIIAKNA